MKRFYTVEIESSLGRMDEGNEGEAEGKESRDDFKFMGV